MFLYFNRGAFHSLGARTPCEEAVCLSSTEALIPIRTTTLLTNLTATPRPRLLEPASVRGAPRRCSSPHPATHTTPVVVPPPPPAARRPLHAAAVAGSRPATSCCLPTARRRPVPVSSPANVPRHARSTCSIEFDAASRNPGIVSSWISLEKIHGGDPGRKTVRFL